MRHGECVSDPKDDQDDTEPQHLPDGSGPGDDTSSGGDDEQFQG